MIKLNDDIYDITQTVIDLEGQYVEEESPDTLAVGMYGYLADVSSLQIQNSIIVASELGNELFPSRAKFERNIISHSILQNISDINAIPAIMSCILAFNENDLNLYFKEDKFIIDKECAINLDGFDMHLEYDIILSREKIINNEYIYTARYDISRNNPLSNIVNPYLNTPFISRVDGENFIFVPCRLMQVEHSVVYNKIVTNNQIDNKTFEFSFDNQLAHFEVKVKDGNNILYLTPVFEGIGIEQNIENYCYYNYISESEIRVKFDSASYIPITNTEVEVLIKTTQGAKGNFDYNTSQYKTLSSETYGYKNLSLLFIPQSSCEGGLDRKSINELKRILPKESLSRGSITCMQDLENYFNVLDSDSVRMYFQKKVDNQFERSYYSYITLKDDDGNIIPTNTINLRVSKDQFDTHDNRKYVLKPGCCIKYDGTYGEIISEDDPEFENLMSDTTHNFLYTVPFMTTLNADPLYMSYYVNIIDYSSPLIFTYINPVAPLQFISNSITWNRPFGSNIYQLMINCVQNINIDKNLVGKDDKGKIIKCDIKAVAVFKNSDGNPYRYICGNLNDYNSSDETSVISAYGYQFKFDLETTDQLNDDTRIRINNMKVVGTGDNDYGFLDGFVNADIYILIDTGESNGRYDLDAIAPEFKDTTYTVCNVYSVQNGLHLFYNYSNIISSKVTDVSIENKYSHDMGFIIKSVPVIKYDYAISDENMKEFINELNYRKAYLDRALTVIENNFEIDFKLFNTYGPSIIYTLDKEGTIPVDRIHLTVNFKLKLTKTSDTYTKDYIINDIKDIIEDLNTMDSLHIPNVITIITTRYRNSIEYFEFLGFNEYGPGVQHLYRNEKDDVTIVPEFLTINRIDGDADINITLD